MGKRTCKQALALCVMCATLAAPLAADDGQRGRGRGVQGNPGGQGGLQKQDNSNRGRANTPRLYQDPASVKGYDSGYDRGLSDGRDGQRYDPVRHREYRDAEDGYAASYGSKDGYKTNFRTGFRQGYEEGYRNGTRSRK